MDVAALPHPPPIDDIHEAMRIVTEAVRDMPKPSMFQLFDEGFSTPFEQLIACIISIRTLEETSLPVSRRLFAVARTPDQVAALPVSELEELITPATFPEPKAANIHAIAVRVRDEFGGALPCDGAVMQEFTGVGPKCANLALGIACGQPTIPVDIHVHRVINRWGYVRAKTPEQTLKALEPKLPMEYRPSINRLLLPFGKYICTGGTPRCLACPLIDICPKIGVAKARK
ncbi:MAG TPA: endonuclease III [Thermomicrobiales bacterium]|jgi:endonuclease-3|nr:endonuclease III [Thermomicrobiales bacterium]